VIVVDTNILAYLWLPSPRNLDAYDLVRVDPEWMAPVLWRSEFRNVASGYLRAGQLSLPEIEAATSNAASCLNGEHSVSDAAVFRLVNQSKCSAYDCEFVALAQSLGTRLVTEDRKLLREFPAVCESLSSAIRGLRS
jgi:predicted nucleic acid-binding protein